MSTKIRNEHRAAWLDGRLHDVPEHVRPLLEASGLKLGGGMNKRTQPETEKPQLEKQKEMDKEFLDRHGKQMLDDFTKARDKKEEE